MSTENLMTTQDVAEYLKWNLRTVQKKAKAGKLPVASFIGGEYRFKKNSIEGWLWKKREANI